MLVEGALSVLGLSASPVPSQTEIRRAYLRMVKQHPPERDRDGFQRVREAFDFLKQNAWQLEHRDDLADEQPAILLPTRALNVALGPISAKPTAPHDDAAPKADAAPHDDAAPHEESAQTRAEASFPESQVDAQLELLTQALSNDDPVVAAKAMIQLYSQPILEAGPVPPPLFTLQTFMELIGRGKLKRARALLEAFEKHAELHRVESSLGNEISARWRLAREVAAVSEHHEQLAKAVASGLSSGRMYSAREAAQEAYERGGLESFMQSRAPTIWGQIAPLITTSEEVRTQRRAFRVGTWPIGLVVVVVINLVRLMGSGCSGTSLHSSSPSVIAPQAREMKQRADENAEAARIGSQMPSLSFRERAQRQAEQSWKALHAALEAGDCEAVREQWPLYRSAASDEVIGTATWTAQKKEILGMCQELSGLLEEMP